MLITFSVHCIHIWRICFDWNIDESIFLKTNEYFRSSGWLAVWTWPVGRALSAPSLCTGQHLHHGRWELWQRSWWLCWWCIIIVLPYYKEMTGKGRGADLCEPQSNTGRQQSDQVTIFWKTIRSSLNSQEEAFLSASQPLDRGPLERSTVSRELQPGA